MLKEWFKKEPVALVVQDMIYEAERLALQHHAAGEHHLALATMYKARVARLKAQIPQPPADLSMDEIAKAVSRRSAQ